MCTRAKARHAGVTTKVVDKRKRAIQVTDAVAPGTNAGVDIESGTGEIGPSIDRRVLQPASPGAASFDTALRLIAPVPLARSFVGTLPRP